MKKGHLEAVLCGCFFIAITIIGILIYTPNKVEAAFGISPPFLNADNLVKGSRYVQTIYLVQDQVEQDLKIKTLIDLPESILKWVTVEPGEEFIIPKGKRQFPVNIAIQVPKDTTLGVYSGTINFQSAPNESGQITIAIGAQVNINLTVGEDIYRKISVPVIKPLDIEEGWSPRAYVKFNNEGNVPESFDGGTFELLDQFGGARLAYISINKGFPETPPFTVKEYVIEFPINFYLGLGQYWGDIRFFKEDKLVASEKTVFNVLGSGSLSSPTAKIFDSIKKHWPYYGGAGVLLLGIVVIKKKKFFRVKH